MSVKFKFKAQTQTQLIWTQVVLINFLFKYITKCSIVDTYLILYNTMDVIQAYMEEGAGLGPGWGSLPGRYLMSNSV